MATIQLNDLASNGLSLFCDSENYLNEIGESGLEVTNIKGGSTPCCLMVSIYAVAVVGGAVIGYDIGMNIRNARSN